MQKPDDIRNLPIDITFSRLGGKNTREVPVKFWCFGSNSHYIYIYFLHFVCFAEWLVDRKRVPADWRKRLTSIRARISTAFASLPKEIDPYFQTLDPEG